MAYRQKEQPRSKPAVSAVTVQRMCSSDKVVSTEKLRSVTIHKIHSE